MKTFASYWRESNLDLSQVEEKLKAHYSTILEKEFPNGEFVGGDFKMGSIEGEAGNSFSFRLSDGVWKDFADQDEIKGKGVISLLSTAWKMTREETAGKICSDYGIRQMTIGWEPVIPPEKHTEVRKILQTWRNREGYWSYRDTNGDLIMIRVRYNPKNEGKRFSDIAYRSEENSVEMKSFPGMKPLYKLNKIAEYLQAKILIQEGEKDCDNAQEILDKKFGVGAWVTTTWPGGAKNVSKVVLHHLKGREIWLWPDNDAPGFQAMIEMASRLKKLEIPAKLRLIQFLPEENIPPKFGLGDPGSENLDLEAMFERAEEPGVGADIGEWVFVGNVKRFVRLKDASWMDVEQFNLMHLHLSKNMAKEFLTDPKFKKFEAFTYWPGEGRVVNEVMKGGRRIESLNLWNGVELKIVEGSRCDKFLNHVERVFPDRAARNHFLSWMAHLVQYPGKKIMHAFLLQGAEGIGKTYFARVFEKLFGSWNIAYVGGADLRSGYTSFMQNAQLVVINELHDSARREVASILKELITDPFYQFKEKFVPNVQLPNRANFFFTTNHEDSIILGEGDRRYFVYFSPMQPEKPEYYSELWASLENETAGIYTLLMNRDLSGFRAESPPPKTREKDEMIQGSLPLVHAYILQMRENAEWPMASGKFTVRALSEALKTKYQVKASDHSLGKILRTYGFVKGTQVKTEDGRSWVWYTDDRKFREDEKRQDTEKLPVDFVEILEKDSGKGLPVGDIPPEKLRERIERARDGVRAAGPVADDGVGEGEKSRFMRGDELGSGLDGAEKLDPLDEIVLE